VCTGQPVPPDPQQVFEQLLEPVHEEAAGDAGDAGDQVTSQAEFVVQEETVPAPNTGEPDAGRRPAAGEEHDLSTEVRDEHHLLQQSPASPASLAAAQSAEVQATRTAVVQEGAVSPEGRDGQRRHGEAAGQRCCVQRCDGLPQETGWCAAHQDRAEILRVGACLDYPVLSYAPGHTTQQGETAWMQFLQYPQCHRLAELLLLYLREQYPQHFPTGSGS
jgi:hypothetical protein